MIINKNWTTFRTISLPTCVTVKIDKFVRFSIQFMWIWFWYFTHRCKRASCLLKMPLRTNTKTELIYVIAERRRTHSNKETNQFPTSPPLLNKVYSVDLMLHICWIKLCMRHGCHIIVQTLWEMLMAWCLLSAMTPMKVRLSIGVPRREENL